MLPIDTQVITPNDYTPVRKCDKVMCYNFKTSRIEVKHSRPDNERLCKVVRLSTRRGIIECSPDTKWLVHRKGTKKIMRTKELGKGDSLVSVISHTHPREDGYLQTNYVKILAGSFLEEEKMMADLVVDEHHNFILKKSNIICFSEVATNDEER